VRGQGVGLSVEGAAAAATSSAFAAAKAGRMVGEVDVVGQDGCPMRGPLHRLPPAALWQRV